MFLKGDSHCVHSIDYNALNCSVHPDPCDLDFLSPDPK